MFLVRFRFAHTISQMAALLFKSLLLLWLFFIFFLPRTARSTQPCETKHCGWLALGPFHFPFQLTVANGSGPCGYPADFKVLCNDRNQTVLTFPKAGDYVVTSISLDEQRVGISDPAECLPRRFMNHELDFIGSPFQWSYLDDLEFVEMSFYKCPPNFTKEFPSLLDMAIPCLGTRENEVLATKTNLGPLLAGNCKLNSSALVPLELLSGPNININYREIELIWKIPDCGICGYENCGFLRNWDLELRCYHYDLPSQGRGNNSSMGIKCGLILGLGIPGLLLGLVCFFSGKLSRYYDQHRQASIETNITQSTVEARGLDGSTIKRYATIQLGESRQLPRSSDNFCSICLCEYQANEILRAIPECNHYFHANCIDGWLKMNATCPLCRNLPGGSALVTSFPVSTTT